MAARGESRGFTLIELLVALFAMALLAVLSWRGLDGMVRAQERTQARADEVLTLQVGLQQWSADLDALVQLPNAAALEWNGRVLRMTRRDTASGTEGVMVVAWSRRVVEGVPMWLRWQSPLLATRGDLDQAWQQADVWASNPGEEQKAREVAVVPLDDWQIFFFRGDAWTNPLSSAETVGTPTLPGVVGANIPAIPDGVRLVLALPEGHAISGRLMRDWVRPTLSGGKS